jgi:SAM-dependent methyltransferase
MVPGVGPVVATAEAHRTWEVLIASLSDLLQKWRDDLAGWAIPGHITSAVTESPWVLPREVFARRADRLSREPAGASYDRERAALDPPGSVLDVGAGAGAASLPLASRITALTAVDTDREMLARLAGRAREAGLEARLLPGRWPDVAGQAEPADLVTCHNVLYNVPDLVPFIEALSGHSRRQVVVELTAAHPLISLNPLWLLFHGLERPEGPTADDVLAILDALGLRAGHTMWNRPAQADYATGSELVETTRRRLCLAPERASDVEAALREAGHLGQPRDLGTSGRSVVTIWWEGSA